MNIQELKDGQQFQPSLNEIWGMGFVRSAQLMKNKETVCVMNLVMYYGQEKCS